MRPRRDHGAPQALPSLQGDAPETSCVPEVQEAAHQGEMVVDGSQEAQRTQAGYRDQDLQGHLQGRFQVACLLADHHPRGRGRAARHGGRHGSRPSLRLRSHRIQPAEQGPGSEQAQGRDRPGPRPRRVRTRTPLGREACVDDDLSGPDVQPGWGGKLLKIDLFISPQAATSLAQSGRFEMSQSNWSPNILRYPFAGFGLATAPQVIGGNLLQITYPVDQEVRTSWGITGQVIYFFSPVTPNLVVEGTFQG